MNGRIFRRDVYTGRLSDGGPSQNTGKTGVRGPLSGGAERAGLTPDQRQLVFDMQFELLQANFLELLIL